MKRIFNITESDLRNIIKRMVTEEYHNAQLNEWTDEEIESFKRQRAFIEKALELVRKMGYETSDYDPDKPCVFKIYNVDDYSKFSRIMEMLNRSFGIGNDTYEHFHEAMGSGINTSTYRVIAPWYNHTSFFNESIIKEQNASTNMKKQVNLSESELRNVIRNIIAEEINEPSRGANLESLYYSNAQIIPALDDVIEFCNKAATLSRNWSNDDKTTMMFIDTLEGLRNIRRQFNVMR